MAQKSMRDAINDALHLEMARDPRVIVLGDDVSGGAGGTSGEREASGGIFGITKGLLPKFGADRVIDTPISESAIIGAAAGAAVMLTRNLGLSHAAEEAERAKTAPQPQDKARG